MNLKNILSKEPVAIGGAVVAVLNALVLLNVVSLDVPQITGINIALVAVLGLLTRKAVTPNTNVFASKAGVDEILNDLFKQRAAQAPKADEAP